MRQQLSLDGQWGLTFLPEEQEPSRHPDALAGIQAPTIPAPVPGTVEQALHQAGIIADPFVDRHAFDLRKYEFHAWWFRHPFVVPESFQGDRYLLVFQGLDTIASIWLNGHEFGHTANMLIAHSFDVTSPLRREGENELIVRLGSAINEARRYPYPPLLRGAEDRPESLWLRKAPHMFGWDITPRIVSAGLWRSVTLEAAPAVSLESLYFWTEAIGAVPLLGVHVQVSGEHVDMDDLLVRLTGTCGDHTFHHTLPFEFVHATAILPIPGGRLWWPRDYGDPDLYTVRAELLHRDVVVDTREEHIGLRQVALDRTEIGGVAGRFAFLVNGVSIQITGSNWVPLDALHSRDAGRYEMALDLATDLNCRMLRCWGGNVYEDHRFFDLCDERGILVWQDFAMACGRYPQADEFALRLEEEARSVITKLRNHPSLIVWCGDNECDHSWLSGELRPEQNRLTREVLPRAVRTHDPYRPFVPSSPYLAPSVAASRDWDLQPEQHLWEPRNYFKSPFYSGNTAHFIGEIGYHGCPNPSSLAQFLPAEHLWPWDNPSWRAHAVDHWRTRRREYDRNELMVKQVREFFGAEPATLREFAMASQIVQAEALKFFIEHSRLRWPVCSGILWWNLLDCWPQLSDAVVDYYFGKKLAYYYIRRAQQPLCLMIGEAIGWEAPVVVGNVGPRERRGSYRIRDAASGTEVLAGAFVAAPNANTALGRIPYSHGEQAVLLLEWTSDEGHGCGHYLAGSPPFDLARYRDSWLPALAALSPEIPIGDVCR